MLAIFKKPSGPVGWIVVFLGNPGTKYDRTRHNAGFMTADKCEKATGARITRVRFRALTDQTRVGEETVLLMKPQTYMNSSGDAVKLAGAFYKLPPERIVVLSDDISLAVGRIRVRESGSAGGHNGLKSIIAQLGSQDFPRVKIGVGAKPNPEYDLADWVLSAFSKTEEQDLKPALEHAAAAAADLLEHGPAYAANRYNGAT